MYRQPNVRAILLQLQVTTSFNYQPIFLVPDTIKYLDHPLINKHPSLKLPPKSDKLSRNQSPSPSTDSVKDAIERGLLFHTKSSICTKQPITTDTLQMTFLNDITL